jgi:hypothetical protein
LAFQYKIGRKTVMVQATKKPLKPCSQSHAPDTESAQYRNKTRGRKDIFLANPAQTSVAMAETVENRQ